MEKFLFKVARDLISRHPKSLSDIQVILPSKRSGLYLNKHLSSILGSAFIAPQIITWNDFLEKYSQFDILDSVSLNFKLYESYLKITDSPEGFDEFSKWSHVILSDFNDIDNYLLKANVVFKNLKDVKEIEDWSFETDDLSKLQIDYLSFWEMLGTLYDQFKNDLKEFGALYSGALKRHVAESINESKEELEHTYWAGFYAISPSEQAIMDYFLLEKKGYVYWNADEYYTDSPVNTAGHFFRNAINHAQKRYNWIEKQINQDKQVLVHEAPGNVLQAAIANEILKSYGSNETAIILADEQLLIPVLENLDSSDQKFNVSLGIPINKSDLFQLIDSILILHEDGLKRTLSNSGSYYFKTVERVLENNIILNLYPKIQEHLDSFTKSGSPLLTEVNIRSILSLSGASELEFLFNPLEEIPKDLITIIQQLVDLLKQSIHDDHWDPFTAEILFSTNQFLELFTNYCSNYPYVNNINSFKRLFKQLSSNELLSFLGEPLGGLQILGMLESRALDFDRVIITSCNEGILPSSLLKPSFIPYDLKLQFGLPTKKEYESIYAYYFYRLFQCSKEIHLIYNSKTPMVGSGEKSRFISQIEFESKEKKFSPIITQKTYNTEVLVNPVSQTKIQKTESILESIQSYFLPRISSSAITTFFTCPLDFYYKYILHAREEDFSHEKIQSNTFGNVIHGLLEELYQPLSGAGVLKPENLDYDIKSIRKYADLVIEKERLTNYLSSSYNELAVNAIVNIVHQFINTERKHLANHELSILGLEEKYTTQLIFDEIGNIGLKGHIDRIDIIDGRLRIIDYKSPLVKDSDVSIDDISKESFVKKPYAFQLMFYALLYSESNQNEDLIFPSIVSLRKPTKDPIDLRINKNIGVATDQLQLFKVVLEEILWDILNADSPFIHNEKGKYCSMCN